MVNKLTILPSLIKFRCKDNFVMIKKGDKLFEKDAKLCLKTDQLLILQEYFQQLLPNLSGATSSSEYHPSSSASSSSTAGDLKSNNGNKRRTSTLTNAANSSSNKEFLLLYKSNQLHIIQDFMFKITNLKVSHNCWGHFE